MMSPHIEKEKIAVPWWAAFGAPLLGVPLLVGLLALSQPAEPATVETPDAEAAWVSDEAEAPATLDQHAVEVRLDEGADPIARC